MYDTALIGLGRIAAQYSSDKKMLENLNYFTHAQVLINHNKFNWIGAVDPSLQARKYAKKNWNIHDICSSEKELIDKERYEVIVLATPPEHRLSIIKSFPSLRAVIVEKPLGVSYSASLEFVEECKKRNIIIQVNLTRRSDEQMKDFAKGGLRKRIGDTQFVFCSYGRGMRNYATHLIDLVRMLIGEIAYVKSISIHEGQENGPIKGDLNLSFLMRTVDNIEIIFQPLSFSFYREGSIEIWGERGRIEIIQEGLRFLEASLGDCRSLDGAQEITLDNQKSFDTGYGDALFNLYTNLADSISKNYELDSSGRSALKTEKIVESIIKSFKEGGKEVSCI
jgi:predicted dehydrogenase